jgi:hypothetical protein
LGIHDTESLPYCSLRNGRRIRSISLSITSRELPSCVRMECRRVLRFVKGLRDTTSAPSGSSRKSARSDRLVAAEKA